MNIKTDILIIGGGIIGSAISYFLSVHPGFQGKITVIEKDPGYKYCSTTLSLGGIRHQFSTPENIKISLFGTEFFRNINNFLRVDKAINLFFKENGYLFLGTSAGKETMLRNLQLQQDLGSDGIHLDTEAISKRFPWLNMSDLIGGNFGMSGEGWIDPFSLLQAFKCKAQQGNVNFIKDTAISLQKEGSKISGAIMKDGSKIRFDMLVNAAGCNAKNIAKMVGIKDYPVESRKRQVHVFRCKESLPDAPLVIDPSGVYFKPEGKMFVCGKSPLSGNDPECDDFDLDFSQFEDEIWPVLAHRVPIFEAIRREHSWIGHYAFNKVDQNAIVGFHPEIRNLILANGFSGHGLQQAPAIGRGIAELIGTGKYQNIDLSPFSYDRFDKGELLTETEVV